MWFKKSQSALEFMMTYGWAFMIIIIMVGSLAYLGVLSPDRLMSDRASAQVPFSLVKSDFAIRQEKNMTMAFRIVNGYGSGIRINDASAIVDYNGVCDSPVIWLDYDGDGNLAGTEVISGGANMIQWEEGNTYPIYVDCGDQAMGLPIGNKVKYTLKLGWYPATAMCTYRKYSDIEAVSSVQE